MYGGREESEREEERNKETDRHRWHNETHQTVLKTGEEEAEGIGIKKEE
jgi:hypothetical protein